MRSSLYLFSITVDHSKARVCTLGFITKDPQSPPKWPLFSSFGFLARVYLNFSPDSAAANHHKTASPGDREDPLMATKAPPDPARHRRKGRETEKWPQNRAAGWKGEKSGRLVAFDAHDLRESSLVNQSFLPHGKRRWKAVYSQAATKQSCVGTRCHSNPKLQVSVVKIWSSPPQGIGWVNFH